ncbi:asparaginase domain-containing protein [Roseivirga sp.]|uniref:asparaginase domain-containing protein n=1 Tax=Roseivirga sp. TaxID=1964215 RepID=UPI003B52D663
MKILIIQTGGTIDKDYPKTNKGYAFEIDEPAVERILQQVMPSFEYEVVSLMKKDSLEITDQDRAQLLTYIKQSEASKILITHGSDTMPETAAFLNKIPEKTIVLTGAYKPERFTNSDAAFNIGVAIGALNTLHEGTFIAMNGMVMPAGAIVKNPDTGKFETK